ncbi:MAG: hypothetical protein MR584_08415 [Galactobacillus timonensis]|nr:hypothetical protein [Galactobacillus timonensis]
MARSLYLQKMQQNVCGEVQLDSAVHRDVCGAESTGSFVERDWIEAGLALLLSRFQPQLLLKLKIMRFVDTEEEKLS